LAQASRAFRLLASCATEADCEAILDANRQILPEREDIEDAMVELAPSSCSA
jgi:hypothetical protein